MIIIKVDPQKTGQELFEIDNAAFTRDFDLKARSVKEEADYLKNSEVYIAQQADKAIGLIGYEMKQDFVEIMSLAVIPEYQMKGIAKHLLSEVLNKVKEVEVRLVTHPRNTPAIIFYLKSGFEIYGWKDNYYGDGQPRLLLRKL